MPIVSLGRSHREPLNENPPEALRSTSVKERFSLRQLPAGGRARGLDRHPRRQHGREPQPENPQQTGRLHHREHVAFLELDHGPAPAREARIERIRTRELGDLGIGCAQRELAILDQPGRLRIGAFSHEGRTANYRQVVALADSIDIPDVNTAVNLSRRTRNKRIVSLGRSHREPLNENPPEALRSTSVKERFSLRPSAALTRAAYINLEQALTPEIGLFARVSAADGRNENLSFTDVRRCQSCRSVAPTGSP
jgi:hypothetical protein